jgi:hypothetical protein
MVELNFDRTAGNLHVIKSAGKRRTSLLSEMNPEHAVAFPLKSIYSFLYPFKLERLTFLWIFEPLAHTIICDPSTLSCSILSPDIC